MIKLDDKSPNTFEKDMYEAMVEEAMARWERGGWVVEPEDNSQSTKHEPNKEDDPNKEEGAYVP